ncbi:MULTISPECIES: DUF2142 domain-containing protein [Methanobacterium]|nr:MULTISPECIES: DUF2142 domain-containing protein [Methanobacterium]OEC86919.1 hypothetical protein A9507_08370 [Methanobacterium sp. A39]
MMNKFRDINPQTAFLIIGLIYGLGFLLATPAFQVPDEYEHFYRSLYVSEGHIVPEKLGNLSGVYVPESVKFTSDTVNQEWYTFLQDRDNKTDLAPLLHLQFNSKNMVFEDISRIAVITYSPVPYLMSAFAIDLGKLFNLAPLVLMYIGRLANLLVWIFLTYLAIKITPVHKWVFFMLALLPMTIFEAASLSADSFLLGISFLIIAIFFKYAFDDNKKRIGFKEIYILGILLLLVGLAKSNYILLLFLIFLIPAQKFGNRKNRILVTGSLFLVVVAVVGIWNLIVNGLYAPIIPQVSISGQIAYLLGDPFRFPYLLINTFISRGLSYQFLFVGNFWLDIPLPTWWLGFYLITIIPAALLDKNRINITRNQKLISAVTFILNAIIACALVYITWTPVGQNVIDGIQGRYFIPIFPLLFLLLYKVKDFENYYKKIDSNKLVIKDKAVVKIIRENLNLILIAYVVIFLSITLLIFITRYYI